MKKNSHYRWRDQQILTSLIFAIGAVFFSNSAVSASSQGIGLTVVDTLIGIGLMVLGVRAFRAGIVLSESGVVVRNLFTTVKVAWSQVASFEVGSMRILRFPVVTLRLHDGETVSIGMFMAPGPAAPAMSRLRRMVHLLESQRNRRQG